MSIHVGTRSNNTLCMRERTKLRRSRCVQNFFKQQLINWGMLNRFIPLGFSLNTTDKCVCCHPMLCSRRQITPFGIICGRTTSRSHAGGRPPSFCGACFNFFSREGFSRPFPSSIVKSNFVYPRHNRSPLVGHDVRENPSSCDCAEIRTHVPTTSVRRFRGHQLSQLGGRWHVYK